MDCGGYFIIKGSEKTVLGQERAAENRVYCFDGKNTTKWLYYTEIKSVPDNKCISPKQMEMMIASKNNGFGNGIYVSIPRIKKPIELFEWLIKTYTNENDLVIDNSAGVLTTGLAAENTNRQWLCIEKEKEYCDKGIQRFQ